MDVTTVFFYIFSFRCLLTKCIIYTYISRFGSGQLSAARAAARKFIDQESAKIAEPFSRQPKVQDIETNEIPQQRFFAISPSTPYIPTFTGSLGPRSPFWLRRF